MAVSSISVCKRRESGAGLRNRGSSLRWAGRPEYGPSVGLRYDASESVSVKLRYDHATLRDQPSISSLALVGYVLERNNGAACSSRPFDRAPPYCFWKRRRTGLPGPPVAGKECVRAKPCHHHQPGNPVQNLDFAELRRIFLGERSHWPNGRRITLVTMEPGSRADRCAPRQLPDNEDSGKTSCREV